MKRSHRRLHLAVIFTAFSLLIPAAAQAAVDHVTSSGDTGSGTLRGVIAAAAQGDTIMINAGVNPSLTGGTIALNQSLTITGQGARSTTITANGKSRIFSIDPSSTRRPTITISNLTMTGGNGDANATTGTDAGFGGALIQFDGTLTLTGVAMRGNAISTSSGTGGVQGGALALLGTSTLNGVTIAGNSVTNTGYGGGANGGGILSFGPTTITDSTIANNTATDNSGSGVIQGGGIYAPFGAMTLVSVTVAGNSTIGAGTPPTTFNEGGNIYAGVISLKNTIIARGSATSGSNCSISGATDNGYNLESTTPSQCGLSTASPTFDLVGAKPYLVTTTPANNGGQTNTLALSSTSPAVDHVPQANCTDASGAALTFDQRGMARPDAGEAFCDIGAYEVQDAPTLTGRLLQVLSLGAGTKPTGVLYNPATNQMFVTLAGTNRVVSVASASTCGAIGLCTATTVTGFGSTLQFPVSLGLSNSGLSTEVFASNYLAPSTDAFSSQTGTSFSVPGCVDPAGLAGTPGLLVSYVWVSCPGSGTLARSPVQSGSMPAVGTLPGTGPAPTGVLADPPTGLIADPTTGGDVIVSDVRNNTLYIYNNPTTAPTASVTLESGCDPAGLAAYQPNPGTGHSTDVFVACPGASDVEVVQINAAGSFTGTPVSFKAAGIAVPTSDYGIAASGQSLVVTGAGSSDAYIYIVNGAAAPTHATHVTSLPANSVPVGVAIAGTEAYIADQATGQVTIIDPPAGAGRRARGASTGRKARPRER